MDLLNPNPGWGGVGWGGCFVILTDKEAQVTRKNIKNYIV